MYVNEAICACHQGVKWLNVRVSEFREGLAMFQLQASPFLPSIALLAPPYHSGLVEIYVTITLGSNSTFTRLEVGVG
jgi:hypothetical protein